MEQWRDPGIETGSPSSNSKCNWARLLWVRSCTVMTPAVIFARFYTNRGLHLLLCGNGSNFSDFKQSLWTSHLARVTKLGGSIVVVEVTAQLSVIFTWGLKIMATERNVVVVCLATASNITSHGPWHAGLTTSCSCNVTTTTRHWQGSQGCRAAGSHSQQAGNGRSCCSSCSYCYCAVWVLITLSLFADICSLLCSRSWPIIGRVCPSVCLPFTGA